ncbi:hypothetical protein L0337_06625 [candidate division KSB1 bacterium]|nr:hypothetical protein [candidate division KSB1 bacterium]
MSARLLTIEGVYDGKSIQPLETVKTSKKHRVLITFLDEWDSPDISHRKKEDEITDIPDELVKQLQALASAAGIDDLRSFIVEILEEKIQAEKDKEFVYAVTDEIRAGLTRAGISEEEIIEDFNRFRRALPRE